MITVDQLGQAIHAAKKVGGPWGPPCGYPLASEWYFGPECPHGLPPERHCDECCVEIGDAERSMRLDPYYNVAWVEIDYDTDPMGTFDCLCKSMASHLIEIMEGKNGS